MRSLINCLILGLLSLFLSGCTAMLVGADVQPVERQDQSDEQDETKRKR